MKALIFCRLHLVVIVAIMLTNIHGAECQSFSISASSTQEVCPNVNGGIFIQFSNGNAPYTIEVIRTGTLMVEFSQSNVVPSGIPLGYSVPAGFRYGDYVINAWDANMDLATTWVFVEMENPQWPIVPTSLNGRIGAIDVKTYRDQYIYATGHWSNDIQFPGQVQMSSPTYMSIYLLKMDRCGYIIWQNTISATSDIYVSSIDVDNSGNIAICGVSSSGIINFPGLPPTSLTGPVSFVAVFDPSGTCLWRCLIEGAGRIKAKDVIFNDLGQVILFGDFSSSQVNFFNQNQSLMYTMPNIGGFDIFSSIYDASTGSFMYADDLGSTFNRDEFAAEISSWPNQNGGYDIFFTGTILSSNNFVLLCRSFNINSGMFTYLTDYQFTGISSPYVGTCIDIRLNPQSQGIPTLFVGGYTINSNGYTFPFLGSERITGSILNRNDFVDPSAVSFNKATDIAYSEGRNELYFCELINDAGYHPLAGGLFLSNGPWISPGGSIYNDAVLNKFSTTVSQIAPSVFNWWAASTSGTIYEFYPFLQEFDIWPCFSICADNTGNLFFTGTFVDFLTTTNQNVNLNPGFVSPVIGRVCDRSDPSTGSMSSYIKHQYIDNHSVSMEESMRVFPNPNTNRTIYITSSSEMSETAQLYSIDGRWLGYLRMKGIGDTYFEIQLDNLQSGIYLLKLKSNGNALFKRIILL